MLVPELLFVTEYGTPDDPKHGVGVPMIGFATGTGFTVTGEEAALMHFPETIAVAEILLLAVTGVTVAVQDVPEAVAVPICDEPE